MASIADLKPIDLKLPDLKLANLKLAERIAQTVLYEGYILYPYGPSSTKNRQRWNWGCLFPQTFEQVQEGNENYTIKTECLIQGGPKTVLNIQFKFLHLLTRTIGECIHPRSHSAATEAASSSALEFRTVEALKVGNEVYHTWEECMERAVPLNGLELGKLATSPAYVDFNFPPSRTVELLPNPSQDRDAVIIREQESIVGYLELSTVKLNHDVYKICAKISNLTPLVHTKITREKALPQSFVSTHAILSSESGKFLSLVDLPAAATGFAETCKNKGTWPILVGDHHSKEMAMTSNVILSSPIILSDFPEIAPESPGDLFDATEIDEILCLRILTLTDEEKHEMRSVDPRAKALLERVEKLGNLDLQKLHGKLRNISETQIPILPGQKVRLVPKGRTDIFDLALQGQIATVESIEQDFENRTYVVVTVDEDPGQDLGRTGLPGHRFFFQPHEVELL